MLMCPEYRRVKNLSTRTSINFTGSRKRTKSGYFRSVEGSEYNQKIYTNKGTVSTMSLYQFHPKENYLFRLFKDPPTKPARPRPNNNSVEGSGTSLICEDVAIVISSNPK